MAFHPYLNFPGTCREAFTRYQEILGGELHVLGAGDMDQVEDADQGEELPPGWDANMVMHAALQVGDGMLMASDAPGAPEPASTYVHYEAADVDDAHRVFAALAEGGATEMPMEETFWSPAFGVCRDRWGTLWMVSAPSEFQMPG